MNIRIIVVSILTVVLVAFYIYALILEINVATYCPGATPDEIKTCETSKQHESGFGTIFTAVGGLIAAVSVGILAINEPTEGLPVNGLADPTLTGFDEKIAKFIPLVFVLVWLIGGVLALYFGLRYSGSPPLTEMAKTWIGTAVAGVGAFIGIRP